MKEICKVEGRFSNIFPEYKKLSKNDRFMTWLISVQGVTWLILTSIRNVQGLISSVAWATLSGTSLSILGVLTLSTAQNAFEFRGAGFKKTIYVYAPCSLQIVSVGEVFPFTYYIESMLQLSFSLTVYKLAVGINFIATLFTVLAGRNRRHLEVVSQNMDKNVEPLGQAE